MKTCRYCSHYNTKYGNCKNIFILDKLKLSTATRCTSYQEVPNCLKATRRCEKLKKGEAEELLMQQEKRNCWLTKSESKRCLKDCDISYRAIVEDVIYIDSMEHIGGTYEIEDEIIAKIDEELGLTEKGVVVMDRGTVIEMVICELTKNKNKFENDRTYPFKKMEKIKKKLTKYTFPINEEEYKEILKVIGL